MSTYDLEALPGRYAVCRLPASPESVQSLPPFDLGVFLSVTLSPDDISVICQEELAPPGAEIEAGWRGMRIAGKLPFLQVGVVAEIARTLARSNVSILALGTYDTDYFFIQEAQYPEALDALDRSGHRVTAAPWSET